MATNTQLTYDANAIREDLSDVIYNIDPTDTPFFTGVGKGDADQTMIEWQTEELDPTDSDNARIEGDDAIIQPPIETARLNNQCQITDKAVSVSGTSQAVNKAGITDNMAHQVTLKTVGMRRDIETILLSNQAKNAGTSSTARRVGSVLSWIATNDNFGATGASPAGTGADTRTDGTQRVFTEELLASTYQDCWTNGGQPDTLMVGAFNKRKFSSNFSGRATQFKDVEDKRVVASADIWEGDFGQVTVIPNRFMRARDALLLQMDMWSVDYLRAPRNWELAKNGDYFRRQVLAEWTLRSKQEAASGGIFDLTTS